MADQEPGVYAWIFTSDPISSTGNASIGPSSSTATLNRLRKLVRLHLDAPPSAAATASQTLASKYVVLVDSPTKAPLPQLPSASSTHVELKFPARTDKFSALCAFYHCDSMFRMIEDTFRFDLQKHLPGARFPVKIVNHAIIADTHSTDKVVNAQVTLNDTKTAIGEMRFALADLRNLRDPLGIATDVRYVWHEFGHALLAGATGGQGRTARLELPFAHSFGDALAAINCDPESRLAGDEERRGETIPWMIGDNRRHDRTPDGFWQWSGGFYDSDRYPDARDPHGYLAEQLLSSSLFRLYRAIGGDARTATGKPDVTERKRAADYVTFLIVSAVLQKNAAKARSPAAFARALIEADADPSPADYRGKANRPPALLHKVIYWAFEQQGLSPR
jgi:hypothetical protein